MVINTQTSRIVQLLGSASILLKTAARANTAVNILYSWGPRYCLQITFKSRPHEKVLPWQVLFARVDGEIGQVVPWQVSLLKSWHASFSTRRLVKDKTWPISPSTRANKTYQGKLVKVKTWSCGRRFNRFAKVFGFRSNWNCVLPVGSMSWQLRIRFWLFSIYRLVKSVFFFTKCIELLSPATRLHVIYLVPSRAGHRRVYEGRAFQNPMKLIRDLRNFSFRFLGHW